MYSNVLSPATVTLVLNSELSTTVPLSDENPLITIWLDVTVALSDVIFAGAADAVATAPHSRPNMSSNIVFLIMRAF